MGRNRNVAEVTEKGGNLRGGFYGLGLIVLCMYGPTLVKGLCNAVMHVPSLLKEIGEFLASFF